MQVVTESPGEEQQQQQGQDDDDHRGKQLQLDISSRMNSTSSDHHKEAPGDKDPNFHYIRSPVSCSQDIIIDQDQEDPFTGNLEIKTHDTLGNFLLDEEPLSYSHQLMCFSTTPKSEEEENGFFDELEELPCVTSSSFSTSSSTSFMGSNYSFEERIPVVPS